MEDSVSLRNSKRIIMFCRPSRAALNRAQGARLCRYRLAYARGQGRARWEVDLDDDLTQALDPYSFAECLCNLSSNLSGTIPFLKLLVLLDF